MDEDSPGLPGSWLRASLGDTSEMEVNPICAHTEVVNSSHPPPPTTDAEEGANPFMTEGQTLVVEDEVMDQGEDTPPVLKEQADTRPASPAHKASKPYDRQEMPPPFRADSRVPSSLHQAFGVPEAELAEHRRVAESALTSSSHLLEQRTRLGAALGLFWTTEAGVMEVFLSLAKGFEVCVTLTTV